jgi:hypothetical protein
MRESGVLRHVWAAVAATTVLFRVNTGRAYVSGSSPASRRKDGSVLVPDARHVALGFSRPDGSPVVGTADLNGWTTVVVTPEMIGRRHAIFTAIETKETGGGERRAAQVNYLDQVNKAGGIAGFVSSPEEAVYLVSDWINPKN